MLKWEGWWYSPETSPRPVYVYNVRSRNHVRQKFNKTCELIRKSGRGVSKDSLLDASVKRQPLGRSVKRPAHLYGHCQRTSVCGRRLVMCKPCAGAISRLHLMSLTARVATSTHASISTKTNTTFKYVWRLSGATHAPLLPSLFLARPRPVTTVRGNSVLSDEPTPATLLQLQQHSR